MRLAETSSMFAGLWAIVEKKYCIYFLGSSENDCKHVRHTLYNEGKSPYKGNAHI